MKKLIISKSLTTFILLLVALTSDSQSIMQDSRGKDVFEYYKGGSLQASFVPSQISMQLNYNAVLGNPYYFYVKGDSINGKTVGASMSISLVGKVTGSGSNQGKPFSINTGLTRPAYRLELGIQRNLNTFYNIRLIPSGNRFTHAVGLSIYGEYQNVNFYDTVSKVASNKRPFVYGIHGHGTWFETQNGILAISVSGDLSRSYNQDQLVPFQQRTNQTYIDPNVTSVGDVYGNIGAFNSITAYRLRVSVPVFITKWISVTPYTSIFGYTKDESKLMPGIAFNFFNGKPAELNSSIVQGFGIGIDWLKKQGSWSSTNVSIYGSLNLDLLRKSLAPRVL